MSPTAHALNPSTQMGIGVYSPSPMCSVVGALALANASCIKLLCAHFIGYLDQGLNTGWKTALNAGVCLDKDYGRSPDFGKSKKPPNKRMEFR